MKIFVTGATGFTGSRVVPLLLKSGFEIRCLYRASSDRSPLDGLNIEWALCDVSDSQSLTSAMAGTDALVNVASLGFGQSMMLCCSSAAECSPLCLLRPMPSLARCRVGVSLNFDSVFVRRCHGNVDRTNAWRFSG